MTVRKLITELMYYNKDAEIGINVNGKIFPFSFGWSSEDGEEESLDNIRDTKFIKNSKLKANSISIYVEDISNDYTHHFSTSEKTMSEFKEENIESDV